MSTYANLALLVGAIGRPGRVFGRQGGHQSAYMYDFDWGHPQSGDLRRNLWHELQRGSIDVLIFSICNPLRMQQQTQQLREFTEKVPFVVDMNIRPQDTTRVADLVLPAAAWGEYTYTRENLERRLRINQKFYDAPGEAEAEYMIFVRIAQRLAKRHGLIDPEEWNFKRWEDIWAAMQRTSEGKALGIQHISAKELAALGTNGIQLPVTRKGNRLIGTERIYQGGIFATPDKKARFIARDQVWTESDPLAFLPEQIKPNKQYPYFVTTVRYQTIWQSGYSYRWKHELANRSVPFMELTVNPSDAKRHRLKDGDWAELRNPYGRTQGVVNVSNQVPRGVISAIFGWAGPTDGSPYGNSRYYANNLIVGGPLQQVSNGAFFKNTRAALRKLRKPPRTARNTPGLSEKNRYAHVSARGAAGNPNSKAKNFVSRTIP
jgi:anaerobic selenocysteine-containing dehydrogenase